MLHFLMICLIAGGAGAVMQGMLGIGTGIVIVPLLTFLLPRYGVSQDLAIHMALATSMAAIATNSISALISHFKRGNVKLELFKQIIIFSVGGSCLGALATSFISGVYLKSIFGTFLLGTAAYMLLKKPAHDMTDIMPDLAFHKIAAGGFSIGLAASIVGSGGGILMVPFLHSLKLKMRYAVGTSTLIGFPVAVVGALTYVLVGMGETSSIPFAIGYLYWPAFLAITLAGVVGAPLGVTLAGVFRAGLLQRVFAVVIVVVGLRMVGGL